MRSIMSASSGADPVASASAWSCSSVTRTRAAADHSSVWSRPARVCTSSSEAATVVRSVGAGAQGPPGGPGVDLGVGEQVDLAVGVEELGGHVGRLVDVDDPVAAGGGAEHGQAATVVGDQLEVDPRPAATRGRRSARRTGSPARARPPRR